MIEENIEWREIPYFPNYECSNTGLIRRKTNGRILKTRKFEYVRNYQCISIYYKKKKYTKFLAKLVYDAFAEKPCEQTIDHIDRDATNNHVSNLRCVSCKDNSNNRDNYDNNKNKYSLTEEVKKEIINKLYTKELTPWGVMKQYGIPTNYTFMVLKRGSWNYLLNE